MKIITAKYSFINDRYEEGFGVAFNRKILRVDRVERLKNRFPDAELFEFPDNYILYSGFVNLHTHLEFSANGGALRYGNFMAWLRSVIENRDELIDSLSEEKIKEAMDEMLRSGVTTFGAISSFGKDLKSCVTTDQRVIYFNEVIGSAPAMVDALFSDFMGRLEDSLEHQSERFYPAVAIHSPYSVHPFLIRKVLEVAKERGLLTTTHFLESPEEREWLEEEKGEFLEFFKSFFNTTKPLTTIDEFINNFRGKPTLFTHCVNATKEELNRLNQDGHSVIHCPRSNRLLGVGKLDIDSVDNLLVATDGLSSNYSLSILDELKSALFLHYDRDLNQTAKLLIKSITTDAHRATNLKIGKLEKGFFADFAVLKIPKDIKDKDSLALHSIINSQVESLFINGDKIF